MALPKGAMDGVPMASKCPMQSTQESGVRVKLLKDALELASLVCHPVQSLVLELRGWSVSVQTKSVPVLSINIVWKAHAEARRGPSRLSSNCQPHLSPTKLMDTNIAFTEANFKRSSTSSKAPKTPSKIPNFKNTMAKQQPWGAVLQPISSNQSPPQEMSTKLRVPPRKRYVERHQSRSCCGCSDRRCPATEMSCSRNVGPQCWFWLGKKC